MENLNLNELNDVFGGARVAQERKFDAGYIIKVDSDGHKGVFGFERSNKEEAKLWLQKLTGSNDVSAWKIESIPDSIQRGLFKPGNDSGYFMIYHNSKGRDGIKNIADSLKSQLT